MIGNKRVIALCTSRIHDAINYKFIEILNKKLIPHNCTLFVYNLCSDLAWYSQHLQWHNSIKPAELAVFDLIDSDVADVLIIMDDKIKNQSITEDILRKNKSSGIPVIIIDGHYENCINVNYDYEDGFEQIVRHVIEVHKVKNPHFMGGFKGNSFSERRMDIFRKVLEENNIPFDKENMVSYGDYWFDHALKACNRIIKKDDVPDAIICANDMMALGVCRSLFNHGYSVPHDVIVTGFDGIEEINMCDPQITSCAFLPEDMAEKILEIILEYFQGGKLLENYTVPPSHLILAESCGCPSNVRFDSIGYFLSRFYRYSDQEKILCEISSKIQTAKSTRQAMAEWKSNTNYNLVCLINKSFLDENSSDCRKPFEDTMTVFADKNPDQTDMYDFPRKNIIPDIQKFIDNKKPLIFMVLDFLNVPFGYVCFSFDTFDYCQIPQIIFSLNHSIGGFRNIRYQAMLKEKMERIYMLDSLTGLYSRNGAFNLLNLLFENAINNNSPVNTVLIDVDKLKYINDTFGHNDGDNAIYITARALRQCVPENALCIRFGGDEMTAFFSGKCNPQKIRSDIYSFLSDYNSSSERPYNVSASVGIYSTFDSDEMNFEHLVKKADELMYMDKISKRSPL